MIEPKYIEEDGQYWLVINDFDKIENIASIDGHLLEDAVKAHGELSGIDFSAIEFDSESDAFVANSARKESLEKLFIIVSDVLGDSSFVEKVYEDVSKSDDSSEDLLSVMVSEGVDISNYIYLEFITDVMSTASVKKLCQEAKKSNYICLFDEIGQVSILVELIPMLEAMKTVYKHVSDLVSGVGAELDIYSYFELGADISEEYEGWFRYEFEGAKPIK